MRIGIGDKCITAIERRVQPFVPVVGPRIRQLGATYQVTMLGARCYPQAERSINMYPCTVLVSDRDQLGEWIECANVKVTGLEDHDGRLPTPIIENTSERSWIETALCICRQRAERALAKSQDPNGSFNRSVSLAAC